MIRYKDTCTLVETTADGYGDLSLSSSTDIPCLFLQATGNSHTSNVELANSDAHIYLDPSHPLLQSLGYRIEGMTLIVNPFQEDEDKCWYKVTRVMVGQRKLLNNAIDNVHVYLKRTIKTNEPRVS